jgi:uncharacterized membrane protein
MDWSYCHTNFKMHDSLIVQCIIVLALAATLLRLARTLPWQNVIACGILIVVISGAFQTLGAKTGIPFGPFFYTENMGRLLFRQVPWPMPLLWVVNLLNARGVARLILKPWRETASYGIWVIAVASLLATLFDAGLEPIASHANHWWVWTAAKTIPAWYGAPWVNFAGWAVVAFFILAIIGPWLIDKKSSGKPPMDSQPLALWFGLMLLLSVSNAVENLLAAAVFSFAAASLVAIAAWRNSRL